MRGDLSSSSESPAAGSVDPPRERAAAESEDLHVRNYDVEQAYDLDVRVRDGGAVFEERYYLQPGDFRSEFGLVDPGTYAVDVRLDNRGWRTTTCRIGAAPAHTALVELGNGVVSVAEGVY